MLELLTIASLCGIIFLLTRRLVQKRRGKKTAAPTRTGLESWIASEVAGIVARKLALSKDEVARTMGDDPDAEIVSSVERVVAGVDIAYVRLPGGQLEVRAEVAFEDGSTERATKTVGWSEIPDAVRDELSRTGAGQVHRAWAMPWGE